MEKIALGAGVSLDWLITGVGDIYTGKTPPGQASPSTGANESPDDSSILHQPPPRHPYVPGPPTSHLPPPTTDKSSPLTPEEAQFATPQAWKEVIAGAIINWQRRKYDMNSVDGFEMADHILKVMVKYARASVAERKNLAERIAADPDIAQLKSRARKG